MEIIDQPSGDNNEKDLNALIENGFEVRIGDYLNQGMEILKQNMGMFIGFTLLTILIMAILSATYVGTILVSGPIGIGFAIVAHRIAKKRNYEFGDFFKGFEFFVPLLVASLLVGIFTMIGFFLLILPGIYLAVAYSGVSYLIVFRKMEFWDAMETSRKVISKEWFSFFGFGIVLALINLAGMLALGVGLLFTIPLTACAGYAAFADIAGTQKDHP
jgi:uncharacterized membrane protein